MVELDRLIVESFKVAVDRVKAEARKAIYNVDVRNESELLAVRFSHNLTSDQFSDLLAEIAFENK